MAAMKLGSSDGVYFSMGNNHVIEPCARVGRLAEWIMEMRQEDLSPAAVAASIPDNLLFPHGNERARNMIEQAFTQSVQPHEEKRQTAIFDFAQSQMLQCYREKFK